MFLSNNPTLTTAQKQAYDSIVCSDKKENNLWVADVSQEVLSKLFQQVVGESLLTLGLIWLMVTMTHYKAT